MSYSAGSSFFVNFLNFFLSSVHSLNVMGFLFLADDDAFNVSSYNFSISLTWSDGMVHSSSQIVCFVGSKDASYGGSSTPSRFKIFSIITSTYVDITRSDFLSCINVSGQRKQKQRFDFVVTYLVGCRLQITSLPPNFLFFSAKPPLGLIWSVVPSVMFKSATL